ncbi:MAG: hypothetical protein NVSMB59_22220 [Vulcanimicrobiaceae bacterium]
MEQTIEVQTPYRMEVIGEYRQQVAEVMGSGDDELVVEPGLYPVVAAINLGDDRVQEGGIIFNGPSADGKEKTVVQFHDLADLRAMALGGDLELAPGLDVSRLDAPLGLHNQNGLRR